MDTLRVTKMKNFKNVFVLCIIFAITEWSCIANCSADPSTAEQQQDRVGQLPGQNFNVNFAHYAGYITVDERSGGSLFYWFFEALEDPSSKPLALWLNGGPGCSSIAYGQAQEIGPFRPKADGKSIYFNPYSWTQVANIIFLESPTGVGFSWSNVSTDTLWNGDKRTARQNLAFVVKWLDRFPQYRGRDLYLIGEGYAGHFVPHLARSILKHNSEGGEIINIQGFMIGNPLINDYQDQRGIFDFMYSLGLISAQTQLLLKQDCAHEGYLNVTAKCEKAHSLASEEIGNIDYYSIFTPPCLSDSSSSNMLSKRWPVGLLKRGYDPCSVSYSKIYFNLPEVQEALHVRGSPVKWEPCSPVVQNNWKDSSHDILPVLKELTRTGLRVWVSSGNTDAITPVTSTIYSLKASKLPTVGPHKPWYLNGQVGGWIQEYQGLTFVVVNGARHEIPLLKPKQALTMFKSFLSGTPMAASKTIDDN